MDNKRAILQLGFAIVITIFILVYGSEIKEYATAGYFGVFLLSLLTSATIIIPAPGWIAVFELGSLLDPLTLAISAGLGASIGELTGFFAGSGVATLVGPQKKLFDDHKKLLKKYSFFAIFFLAFIPNPIFDIAGITAGALKIDVKKFLIACAFGKILKFLLIAYLGLFSLEWI